MVVWSYDKGRKIFYDDVVDAWVYSDNKAIISKDSICVRCGKTSTKDGYDHCLGFLGVNVKSACCGHGAKPGYIRLKDGRMFIEQKIGSEVLNDDE